MRDGEGHTLKMASVEEDLDRVVTRPLEYGKGREWQHDWRRQRKAARNVLGWFAESNLTLYLRKDWIPVRIDDLDTQLVGRVRLRSVVRELRDENDAERCRKLLSPEDRDSSAKDVRLALGDLRRVGEKCVVKLQRRPSLMGP